jgi:hypothetical protein
MAKAKAPLPERTDPPTKPTATPTKPPPPFSHLTATPSVPTAWPLPGSPSPGTASPHTAPDRRADP